MPIDPHWEVSVQDVKTRLDKKDDFLLLDVRQPEEFAVARIPGARLVPLGDLAGRIEELQSLAEGRPIVAHCHHGGRSLKAASFLRQSGFPDVRSMAGGIDAWSVMIDPTVARY